MPINPIKNEDKFAMRKSTTKAIPSTGTTPPDALDETNHLYNPEQTPETDSCDGPRLLPSHVLADTLRIKLRWFRSRFTLEHTRFRRH
jgi:hypothetical protein